MPECELCYSPILRAGLCRECQDYRDYYDGLTSEEKRAEHESIARYVEWTEQNRDQL